MVLPVKSNSSSWTDIEVPFSELEYLWGDSQEVNLVKPMLHIAISKKESDDEGGTGKMSISQVELYK